MAGIYTANGVKAPSRKQFRNVQTAPDRILDAPELVDDYYLNLLDWSSTNTVAIALGTTGDSCNQVPRYSPHSIHDSAHARMPLLVTLGQDRIHALSKPTRH